MTLLIGVRPPLPPPRKQLGFVIYMRQLPATCPNLVPSILLASCFCLLVGVLVFWLVVVWYSVQIVVVVVVVVGCSAQV